jgi:hypothetical protein
MFLFLQNYFPSSNTNFSPSSFFQLLHLCVAMVTEQIAKSTRITCTNAILCLQNNILKAKMLMPILCTMMQGPMNIL